MQGAPALALSAIRHRYGALEAVAGVDLAVAPGEVVCLLGPSGCGKTTLLRLAAGLERLQDGAIAIAGEAVAGSGHDLPPEARGVGLVFQDFALFPHLSVTDNIAFGLRGQMRALRQARVRAVLAQVQMEGYARSYPHQLSGGQQQRVALARALAPAPKILLLDEPFSGLDDTLRREVREATLSVLKAAGIATLMVTHDPEEAMFMADRIALMRAGRLEQVGPPPALYYQPANAFVTGFFGEVNRLHGRVAGAAVPTPLGRVDAGGLPPDSLADVLIRSEGVVIGEAAESSQAEVVSARLLGRNSLIRLALPDGAGGRLELMARAPGSVLPSPGAQVAVHLDPALTFVFAAGSPT